MSEFFTHPDRGENKAGMPPSVRFLIEAGSSAPSADNSQPWRFVWNERMLAAYAHRRSGFPVDYHASLVAYGAVCENLAKAAHALNLPMDQWHFDLPDSEGRFALGEVNGSLPEDIGKPWLQRHTNRHPYDKQPLAPDILDALDGLSEGDCFCRVFSDRSSIAEVGELVRRAAAIRFRTQEVHEWFAESLRFGNRPEDYREGLNVNTLKLPAGGSLLLKWTADWNHMRQLNRFGLYKMFAAVEASSLKETPAVVAILGPDSNRDALDAGRLLQRAWIHASINGYAGHPFYVLSDLVMRRKAGKVPDEMAEEAESISRDAGRHFNGATVHCLLRVGKPSGSGAVSSRRPMEEVSEKGL